MDCFHPVPITVHTNSGIVFKMNAPCGKCEACVVKKKNSWTFRLREEYNSCRSAFFVTLTYEDDFLSFCDVLLDEPRGERTPGIDGDREGYSDSERTVGEYFEQLASVSESCRDLPERFRSESRHYNLRVASVNKKDVQLFLKRLRKPLGKFRFKYFLVSEYGPTTYRPHYHMLLFNFPKELDVYEHLHRAWGKGFISVSKCNEARIRYCAKYCITPTILPDYLPKTFMCCSKGMGKSYVENPENVRYHKENMIAYRDFGKYKEALPRYYKDKIFSDEEKEQLLKEFLVYKAEKDFEEMMFHRFATREERQARFTAQEDFKKKVRSKYKKSKI